MAKERTPMTKSTRSQEIDLRVLRALANFDELAGGGEVRGNSALPFGDLMKHFREGGGGELTTRELDRSLQRLRKRGHARACHWNRDGASGWKIAPGAAMVVGLERAHVPDTGKEES